MRQAFTLIELLLVISIIAILSAMTLSGVMAVQKAAKRHQSEMVLAKVDTAARLFFLDVRAYPRSAATAEPVRYAANGALIPDASTGLPIPENNDVWASGTKTWAVGNGLFSRLGQGMPLAEQEQAVTNAETLRQIEFERFYHIGNFGNMSAEGLAKPSGWMLTPTMRISDTYKTPEWSYYDPMGLGPSTLGEHELKTIHDHFRFSPARFRTSGEEGNANTRHWSSFSLFVVQNFQRFLSYARPRDAADAYKQALRNGVASTTIHFDSGYAADALASDNGRTLFSRSVPITTASQPWSGDYLVDLEPRYRSDVDGDGHLDILDAYQHPIVYISEGLPPAQRIVPRMAAITWSAFRIYYNGTDIENNLLRYHPDPDLEKDPDFFAETANSRFFWVTDRANARGVTVRADAASIAAIRPGWASSWIYAHYGYDPYTAGDPYTLAGTLIPSRIATRDQPTNTQSGERYFCVSADGSALNEPYRDSNGNGIREANEPFIDRNLNGIYDADIAANDIRLVAPLGSERGFELWSAGRDGRFHALRIHGSNVDNLGLAKGQ